MTRTQTIRTHARLTKEADDTVEAYADHIRTRYIVPFCDKYRVVFLAGNGSWSFIVPNLPGWDNDICIGHGTEVSVPGGWKPPRGFRAAFRSLARRLDDLLDGATGEHNDVGSLCESYDPADNP